VVGDQEDGGVFPKVVAVHGVEDFAEPVVDHGEFGPVVGA